MWVIRRRRLRTPASSFALILPLLLALAPGAQAHPLFHSPSQWFQTGGQPRVVAVGDLNGDQRPDVAVVNYDAVVVLFANRDGTFGNRTSVAGTGTAPRSLVIADFNEDGRPDLAVGNGGWIRVLPGDGAGGFGAHLDSPVPRDPALMHVADIDHDGHLDVATTGSVLLGNGDGTFRSEIPFDPGIGPSSVASGDFDGDGRLDLVTTFGDNQPEYQDDSRAIYVRLGHGDGTFGVATGYGQGYYPGGVAVADFDRDGHLDVAFANFGHTPDYFGSLTVMMGNGDGTFGAQYTYDTGTGPCGLAVADYNLDGLPDVAVVEGGDDPDWDGLANSVSVFLGNGNGTLRLAPRLYVTEDPSFIAVADFDGNGTPDLVTPSWSYGMVTVLPGNGDGTFGSRTFGVAGHPNCMAIGDVNADGRLDLVTANSGDYPTFAGTISVLVANANGDGGYWQGSFATGSGRDNVTLADLDGDGKLDLVMTLNGGFNGTGKVSVMLGHGNGTFGPIHDFVSGSSSAALAIADLDADGRLDAVVANTFPSTVAVLLGNGDGTFRARTEYACGTSPISVAVGDLNGDGRLDVLTENDYYPRTYSAFLGRGDGTLPSRIDTPAGIDESNQRSLVLADVNADGRLDLVAAGFVRLGNGDGTFGPSSGFLPPRTKLVVRDFDGDGRLDVGVANDSNSGEVAVVLGNGDGTFRLEGHYGVGQGTGSPVAGDLDGDGRIDLAVANANSKTVSILTNLGGSPPVGVPAGGTEFGVLALRAPVPNPVLDGRLQVEFTLGANGPARLELIDVAGRVVRARQVELLGAGRHSVDLSSGRAVSPGIYVVRLTQGGRAVSAKAAILK